MSWLHDLVKWCVWQEVVSVPLRGGEERMREQNLEIPEIPELNGLLRIEDKTKMYGVTCRQFQYHWTVTPGTFYLFSVSILFPKYPQTKPSVPLPLHSCSAIPSAFPVSDQFSIPRIICFYKKINQLTFHFLMVLFSAMEWMNVVGQRYFSLVMSYGIFSPRTHFI